MELFDLLIEDPVLVLPAMMILAFIVQMVYYLGVYSAVLSYKVKDQDPDTWPPVSVIICARDEETNLEKNLPAVLEQDYPDYEVIVSIMGRLTIPIW